MVITISIILIVFAVVFFVLTWIATLGNDPESEESRRSQRKMAGWVSGSCLVVAIILLFIHYFYTLKKNSAQVTPQERTNEANVTRPLDSQVQDYKGFSPVSASGHFEEDYTQPY